VEEEVTVVHVVVAMAVAEGVVAGAVEMLARRAPGGVTKAISNASNARIMDTMQIDVQVKQGRRKKPIMSRESIMNRRC
jgi:hypothetical protein